MKKIFISLISALLCCAILLSGCGCDGNKPVEEEATNVEPASFPATETKLVSGGKSDYVIVVPKDCGEVNGIAADELQNFLGQSTGVTLPIVTDEGLTHDNTQKRLSVGNTALLKAQTDIVIPADAGDTEPFIYTKGNTVYMTGNADYGILYSVYKFLEYEIGYKAYAVDCVTFDYHPELSLLDFNYHYAPSVDYYESSETIVQGKDKILANARMFLLGCESGARTLTTKFFSGYYCHTMYMFVPESTEFVETDENGNRVVKKAWNNDQVCLTDERVLDVFVENLTSKAMTSTGPAIMIGNHDNDKACDCDGCKEALKTYKTQGGLFTLFLNKAAKRVEENLKALNIDRKFDLVGLMYLAYEAAPVDNHTGEIVPVSDDLYMYSGDLISVCPCIAPMLACYTHPFGDEACETNQSFTNNINAWKKLAGKNKFYLYTYGNNHGGYDTYFWDNWSNIIGTAVYAEQIDTKTITNEGGEYGFNTPFSTLRSYVYSRLAWNAHLKFTDICEEFFDAYYGPAADLLSEYFWRCTEQSQFIYKTSKKYHQDTYYAVGKEVYWSQSMLKGYASLLESAMIEVENSGYSDEQKAEYKERVYREYLLVRYNEYRLYGSYLSESERDELKEFVKIAVIDYNIVPKHAPEDILE